MKPNRREKDGKTPVSGTRSLLKAIKVLTKETNMIRKLRANVARWFTHIDSFN